MGPKREPREAAKRCPHEMRSRSLSIGAGLMGAWAPYALGQHVPDTRRMHWPGAAS